MRKIFIVICSLFSLSFSGNAFAQYHGAGNYPASYYGPKEDKSAIKNLPACKAVQSLTLPIANPPSSAFKNCNAWNYFYGLHGQRVDYEKARLCALNTENDKDEILNSYQILEMIYANGYGTKQDLKLATKFACENEESKEVITDLASPSFNKTFTKDNPFDVCNYSTDPNVMTICNNKLPMEANHNALVLQIKDANKNWPAQTQQLFKKLQEANNDYIQAYVSAEIDLSVYEDRRTYDTMGELHQAFSDDFTKFIKNTYPTYSEQQFTELDQQLNTLYKKLMALKESSYDTGITHTDMRNVQRKWLHYRDAWVAFAVAQNPTVDKTRIKAWQTSERIEDLQNYLDEHA